MTAPADDAHGDTERGSLAEAGAGFAVRAVSGAVSVYLSRYCHNTVFVIQRLGFRV